MHNLESFKSSSCKQVAKAQMRLHDKIDSLGLSKFKKISDVSWHYFKNQVDFSLISDLYNIGHWFNTLRLPNFL